MSYVLGVVVNGLHAPRWQPPGPLARGAHLRWQASARAVNVVSGDTLVVGDFERAATFAIAP